MYFIQSDLYPHSVRIIGSLLSLFIAYMRISPSEWKIKDFVAETGKIIVGNVEVSSACKGKAYLQIGGPICPLFLRWPECISTVRGFVSFLGASKGHRDWLLDVLQWYSLPISPPLPSVDKVHAVIREPAVFWGSLSTCLWVGFSLRQFGSRRPLLMSMHVPRPEIGLRTYNPRLYSWYRRALFGVSAQVWLQHAPQPEVEILHIHVSNFMHMNLR